MATESMVMSPPTAAGSEGTSKLLKQYGCGPIQFVGTDNALYERHLVFDNVIDVPAAGSRERFEAFARSIRDILSQRWVRTEQTYDRQNPKRVYYLSMEFLLGRSLANNVTNLLLEPLDGRGVFVDMNRNGIWDVRETPSEAWRRLGLLAPGESLTRERFVACVDASANGLRQAGFFSDATVRWYADYAMKASLDMEAAPAATAVSRIP